MPSPFSPGGGSSSPTSSRSARSAAIGTRVLTVIPVAALLYYLREAMPNDGARYQPNPVEGRLPTFFSFAASIALVALARFEFGRSDAVIAWAAFCFALLTAGVWTKAWDYRVQAYLVAVAAFLRSWTTNFALIGDFHGVPERIATMVPVIVALFAAGLLWRGPRAALAASAPLVLWRPIRWLDRNSTPILSGLGVALFASLLYFDLHGRTVTAAWAGEGVAAAAVALALYKAGVRRPEVGLRYEGYALAILALGRLFLTDLNAPGTLGGISLRLLTAIPVVASFYYLRYAIAADAKRVDFDRLEKQLPIFYGLVGTVALMALAHYELGSAEAVIAWAMLFFALLWSGVQLRQLDLRVQAYLIAIAVCVRSFVINVQLSGEVFGVSESIATTVPAILALFAAALLWRKERSALAASPDLPPLIRWLDANSTQFLSVFGVGLLAALLYYSVAGNVLTIAWAAEGLAVTAAGFLVRERVLRLAGLALIAVCLVKGFAIDLQGVDPIYRIISFIVLGMILVGISFVYTKYRHLIRPYI